MINEIFIFFFQKSSKSNVCFAMTAYLNLNAKFSSEILDPYLDFVKYTVKNVDSHSQVAPRMLKSFPRVETSIGF